MARAIAQAALGNFLADEEDYEHAAPLLRSAIASGLPLPALSAKVALGSILIKRGDGAAGREMLSDVIAVNSSVISPGAAWLLGSSLDEVDDLAGAERAYDLAIASEDPHWSPTARMDLAHMLTNMPARVADAVALLQDVVATLGFRTFEVVSGMRTRPGWPCWGRSL